jgi:hypothetical protein
VRRRGFTTVEVVVASFLAVVLGVAVASALQTTSRSTKASLLRASTEREVREVADEFTQYVRGAQPPLGCEEPSSALTFADCVVLLRDGSAFLEATEDSVRFFTRTKAVVSPGDPLELITMTVEQTPEGSKLLVERQSCNNSDILRCGTTADYDMARVLVRTLTLSSRPPSGFSSTVFSFLDADGRPVCEKGCSDPEDDRLNLQAISVVRFDPGVDLELESGVLRVGLPVFVSLGAGDAV